MADANEIVKDWVTKYDLAEAHADYLRRQLADALENGTAAAKGAIEAIEVNARDAVS